MYQINYDNLFYQIIYLDSDQFGFKDHDNQIIDKIKNFSKLNDGWDYGFGVKPSNDVLTHAIGIYQYGLLLGFRGDARPDPNGGVIVNLFIEDDFVYITTNPNRTLDLRHEKGIGINYEIITEKEDASFEYLGETLQKLKKQCFLSELYTSKNMTVTAEDSQVIVSSDTEMAYPSF